MGPTKLATSWSEAVVVQHRYQRMALVRSLHLVGFHQVRQQLSLQGGPVQVYYIVSGHHLLKWLLKLQELVRHRVQEGRFLLLGHLFRYGCNLDVLVGEFVIEDLLVEQRMVLWLHIVHVAD